MVRAEERRAALIGLATANGPAAPNEADCSAMILHLLALFPHEARIFEATEHTSRLQEVAVTKKLSPKASIMLGRCGVATVALYFPQWHVDTENSLIHGENWTEWGSMRDNTTSSASGLVAYDRPAHQPMLHPLRGQYNIGDHGVTLRAQAAEAKRAGFHAFCFYHYWFGYGRIALASAIEDAILRGGGIGIDFFFSWDSHPWEKRWNVARTEKFGNNGSSTESAKITWLAQEFGGPQSWAAHFNWFLPFFRHKNYVKIDGKPVLMFYDVNHMNRAEKERQTRNPRCSNGQSTPRNSSCDNAPFGCAAAEKYLEWYPHVREDVDVNSAHSYHESHGKSKGYAWPRSTPCEETVTSNLVRRMIHTWKEMARDNGFPGVHIIAQAGSDTIPSEAVSIAGRDNLDGVFQFLPVTLPTRVFPGFLSHTAMACNAPRARTRGACPPGGCGRPPDCDCFLRHVGSDQLDRAYVHSARNITLHRGAMMGFSDTPRRKLGGWAFCAPVSPIAYHHLVRRQLWRSVLDAGGATACSNAMLSSHNHDHSTGSSYKHFVFTNAWNEWTEQAVVEPSQQFDYQFLEMHHQAIQNVTQMVLQHPPGIHG